jgi:hypothetical protein
MKKVVALVGASAMVMMLGLGSGFAQQQSPPQSGTGSAMTGSGLEKAQTTPVKPTAEVKSEKAGTAVKAPAKAGECKAAVKKPGKHRKTPKAAVKASSKSGKTSKAATEPGSSQTMKATDKAPVASPGADANAAKTTPVKSPEGKADSPVPAKRPADKPLGIPEVSPPAPKQQ